MEEDGDGGIQMDVKKELEQSRKKAEKSKRWQVRNKKIMANQQKRAEKRAAAEVIAREKNSFSYRRRVRKWEKRITKALWDSYVHDYMYMARRADKNGVIETKPFRRPVVLSAYHRTDFFGGSDQFLEHDSEWFSACYEGRNKLGYSDEYMIELVWTEIQKKHPVAQVSEMQWWVRDETKENQESYPYFILSIPGPHPVSKL